MRYGLLDMFYTYVFFRWGGFRVGFVNNFGQSVGRRAVAAACIPPGSHLSHSPTAGGCQLWINN